MSHERDLEALRRALRGKLADGEQVAVASADLRRVLDELGRLQQSNDRLRRQNRRVRLRLQRAGLADETPQGVDEGADEGSDAP
jgi:hypothetical protein